MIKETNSSIQQESKALKTHNLASVDRRNYKLKKVQNLLSSTGSTGSYNTCKREVKNSESDV